MEFSGCWRNILSVAIAVVLLSLAPPLAHTARAQSQAPASSTSNENDIRAATVLFYAAFNSALHGDLAPMSAVWSHRPDVTSLSAAGGHAKGWNEVYAGFQNIARLYPGGNIEQRDMTIVAGKDMGYSVCIETGQLRSSEGPMVKFNQRATNIFRLEGGTWKLIHHHADSNLNEADVSASR
ncbi:MAG: nuclear transport factor 2 family protein [Candidatus Binatus sp.]|uniref:YybH family protein n=1 Tax=Candidatus Binatus sp. TaxID=2811406 RepID=UPI003BB21257